MNDSHLEQSLSIFKRCVMREISNAHPKFISLYADAITNGLHYHNINHVKYILNKLLNVEKILPEDKLYEMFHEGGIQDAEIRHRATVLVYAAYGHDCYYDPYLKDGLNESLSAEITYAIMISDDYISDWRLRSTPEKVVRYIMNTANHLSDIGSDADFCSKLFLDLDMYSFADDLVYASNSRDIELEYSKMPRELLLKGRIDFLTKLLAKDKIFYLVNGEETARKNIRKSIDDAEFELETLTAE